MIVYLIAMLVVLTVAAGVVAMVLVGIEGRRLDRYPQLSEFLTRAAAHLSGETAEHRIAETRAAESSAEAAESSAGAEAGSRAVGPRVRERV